jgi:hypothetical protein
MPPEEPGLIACIDPEVGQVAKEPKHGGPRPGAGRPKSDSDNVAVKMNAGVVAEAKMVAASRKISLAEYLSETMRPIVRQDLEHETARRIHPAVEGEPKKSSKGRKGKKA